MLLQLQISNFALIDHLSLEFGPGLSILTGETGAGKSIVIDALNAVLGERIGSEFIRAGSDKAIVEGAFDITGSTAVQKCLEESGIEDEDGTLLLTREITANGRNSCRVNGRMLTAGMMRRIGESLVDIHGQHEHQSLLAVECHQELLDRLAGSEMQTLLNRMAQNFGRLHQLRSEAFRLQKDARERARLQDLYQFQVKEIDSATLKEDEEEELLTDKTRLANAEKLHEASGVALASLEDGEQSALDNLREAATQTETIASIDSNVSSIAESLSSVLFTLEDLAHELRDYQEQIEFNPERLSAVEDRLDLIRSLKKKYGSSISEILKFRDETAEKLDSLEHNEERSEKLQQEISAAENECLKIAEDLTCLRKQTAERFEHSVEAELSDLSMAKTQFKVEIAPAELNATGADHVEFLISPNPGEPLKPLAKIASGGEMSRIMLALKTLLARVDAVPTLVFDEIDTGIGGRTALSVGEKLARLGKDRQVLCVTHLPQVASRATTHYSIEKKICGERTLVTVHPLDSDKRIQELARMMGSTSESDAAMLHAKELLEQTNI